MRGDIFNLDKALAQRSDFAADGARQMWCRLLYSHHLWIYVYMCVCGSFWMWMGSEKKKKITFVLVVCVCVCVCVRVCFFT